MYKRGGNPKHAVHHQAGIATHINCSRIWKQLVTDTMDTTPLNGKTIRLGAVQAEPVWHDLDGCVDKTIRLIEQAAADGVQVLGFPEVWIPGYPW